jgi:plasmid stability protein
MAMMTIRNIPDAIHNALKARAKRNKRSAEAEVRSILEEVTHPTVRPQMGDELMALGRTIGLTDQDIAVFEQVRDTTPAEPTSVL